MPDEILDAAADAEAKSDETSETVVDDAATDTDADAAKDGEADDDVDSEAAKAAEETKKDEEAADKEPEVRKRTTPADFIRERQARKAARESEAAATDTKANETADDEIPEADQESISKVAGEMMRPLLEEHLNKQDEQEISDFLADPKNEAFKEYRKEALKLIKHESRRHLPISTIFLEAAGYEGIARMGAAAARAADAKARESRVGGDSQRDGGGNASVWSKSGEDFAAEQARVRAIPRD